MAGLQDKEFDTVHDVTLATVSHAGLEKHKNDL